MFVKSSSRWFAMNSKFSFLVFLALSWVFNLLAMEAEFINILRQREDVSNYEKSNQFNLYELEPLTQDNPKFLQLTQANGSICIAQVASGFGDDYGITYYEAQNFVKIMQIEGLFKKDDAVEAQDPIEPPVIFDPMNGKQIAQIKTFIVSWQDQKVQVVQNINLLRAPTQEQKKNWIASTSKFLAQPKNVAVLGVTAMCMLITYAYGLNIEPVDPCLIYEVTGKLVPGCNLMEPYIP